ncbi:hypothetical protein [Aeromicrobium sp. UC242_57]|uniref:hypothetical protein n=1 Tax=Aeromicrobium sp. UC242_57 TaxID=3374624 RepID=UPI0037A6197B
MDDADRGSADRRCFERVVDDFAGQIGEILAFARQVAGEVALVAAKDPDVLAHHALLFVAAQRGCQCAATVLQLTEYLHQLNQSLE